MLMLMKEKTRFSWRAGMKAPLGAMTMAAVLCGCGGGGSSQEGPTTTLPEANPITLPITEMPTSSYSGFKQEAFERLNEARIAAGVSAVRQNAQLDAAAQAHAEYLAVNYVTGHYEDPTKPLFTGRSSNERASAQGYPNRVRTEIVTNFFSDAGGNDHINFHLTSVYHLAGALDPSSNEVGVGVADTSIPSRYIPSSFTLGTTDQRLRPVEAIWVWPTAGSVDMPRRFFPASETPNPFPDLGTNPSIAVGAPIMFCSSHNDYAPLEILSIGLVDKGTSRLPQSRVLHHPYVQVANQPGFENRADANLVELANSHCIFIVPKEELTAGSTYQVEIRARQGGFNLAKNWSFTAAQ